MHPIVEHGAMDVQEDEDQEHEQNRLGISEGLCEDYCSWHGPDYTSVRVARRVSPHSLGLDILKTHSSAKVIKNPYSCSVYTHIYNLVCRRSSRTPKEICKARDVNGSHL